MNLATHYAIIPAMGKIEAFVLDTTDSDASGFPSRGLQHASERERKRHSKEPFVKPEDRTSAETLNLLNRTIAFQIKRRDGDSLEKRDTLAREAMEKVVFTQSAFNTQVQDRAYKLGKRSVYGKEKWQEIGNTPRERRSSLNLALFGKIPFDKTGEKRMPGDGIFMEFLFTNQGKHLRWLARSLTGIENDRLRVHFCNQDGKLEPLNSSTVWKSVALKYGDLNHNGFSYWQSINKRRDLKKCAAKVTDDRGETILLLEYIPSSTNSDLAFRQVEFVNGNKEKLVFPDGDLDLIWFGKKRVGRSGARRLFRKLIDQSCKDQNLTARNEKPWKNRGSFSLLHVCKSVH